MPFTVFDDKWVWGGAAQLGTQEQVTNQSVTLTLNYQFH
jgi:hypothetical protein